MHTHTTKTGALPDGQESHGPTVGSGCSLGAGEPIQVSRPSVAAAESSSRLEVSNHDANRPSVL
jgi:hypothetical protein